MSSLALYGTCEAIIGEYDTGKAPDAMGRRTVQPITCTMPATHQADSGDGQRFRLCDDHAAKILRGPQWQACTIHRLDQGGA